MAGGRWNKLRERGVSGVLHAIVRRGRARLGLDDPDRFLRKVNGVIHVGASSGQEREIYAGHNLKVLWVEPLPQIFAQLQENIRGYPKQTAVNRLITDADDRDYTFHVANNEGQSSSILELDGHRDIWPQVTYEAEIALKSVRLDTLLERIGAGPHDYQALVMDTQGSELLVLKGATNLLPHLSFVKSEAADFEAYVGCARVDELVDFLKPFGFRLIGKQHLAQRQQGGAYHELLFRK